MTIHNIDKITINPAKLLGGFDDLTLPIIDEHGLSYDTETVIQYGECE